MKTPQDDFSGASALQIMLGAFAISVVAISFASLFAAARSEKPEPASPEQSFPQVSAAISPSGQACMDDSWRATNNANAPGARGGHTAVWTGTEMIVWGGGFNTGGRYNPILDSWAPTSLDNGTPVARGGHTAIWTGSEMIVWGGDRALTLNTGARYNTLTNSWTGTSVVNGPSARTNHTAVWTGSEMIVWGGESATGCCPGGCCALNSGGRYNPVTDSWTPMSTVNVPSARFGQAAVWTGTEMIVWGGSGGSNIGGRYNPTTDTWTPTSAINAPAGRLGPSGVWTGQEMIVWGGWGTGINTGGRYNPATDSWTPTSTTGAPSGRRQHTAIWTGDEMIVWGGETNFVQNTGGRYDPATDSWRPTGTSNVPIARNAHTAVWTGSEMIVWGGSGNDGVATPTSAPITPTPPLDSIEVAFPLSDGGRYCAQSLTTPTPTPVPTPELTVSLPIDTLDNQVPLDTVFLKPVMTTNIDAGLKYVGFQGDFTFDEEAITFSSPFVEPAGLTAIDWNVSGNILPGPGPVRILRVSALSKHQTTPLNGSGILYNLRMLRVSNQPGRSTPLDWQAALDRFIFIDSKLNKNVPSQTDGFITITGAGPTATPTPTPTPTPTSTPTPSPTPTPTPVTTCIPVITHSSTQTITPGSVSCNGGAPNFFHAENSYWRAFNMATFTGGAPYIVTSVSFGIENAVANPAVGNQPVTVRLHTQTTGVFPAGTRTQIATTTVNVTNQMATVLNVPLVAFVPAGTSELIMEVFTPDGAAPISNSIFIGSNAAAQTGPSYISAADCGITSPTDLSTFGFPNMHIVFNINGSCPEPTPPVTPTIPPSPTPIPCPFAQGFDDITALVPGGWSMRNNSQPGPGTTGWFQGNNSIFPAQSGAGSSYIGANFNNGTGTSTLSNWLLTPPLTLRNGMVLTFWTRTVDTPAFPDRLQIRMSTNGASTNVGTTATSVGDFTTLLLDINPTYTTTGYPTSWTQFAVTLSGIPSPTLGRLAFRYFVENGGPNGTNSDYIGIDTFNISGGVPCPCMTPSFSNSAPIAIPGSGTNGISAPYPSTIMVSGVDNSISKLEVTLRGVTHAHSRDIDVLLVGPHGQNAIIMSDAGSYHPVAADLFLMDYSEGPPNVFHAYPLPNGGPMFSGSYQPTNFVSCEEGAVDVFPPPAQKPSGAVSLSTFNGSDPNGTWSLYAVDDKEGNVGNFSGGWDLKIFTGTCPTATPIGTATPTPGPTNFQIVAPAVVNPGVPFSFTVTADFGAYLGTMHFTSSDPLAVLPNDSGLINGMGTFTATLNQVSTVQTITATDTGNFHLTGISNCISVYGPTPTPTPSPTPSPTATATVTATPTATPTPTPGGAAQALNLSTRLRVGTGDDVGIGGFIITGTGPRQVLLRGIGPALINFGVIDALPDPLLELHGPDAFVTITNNNWRDTQEAEIEATGIAPTHDLESAILVTLDPGAYTAVLGGINNGTGVGLVEIYDLTQETTSKLANISTRGFVGTGSDIIIAGFILGRGSIDDGILVRGIGPSLTTFGVPNALANPTLELRNIFGDLVASNDDWQSDPPVSLPPDDPLESALEATLPPGPYTALLSGVNNGTGVGLVEVYDLGLLTPTPSPTPSPPFPCDLVEYFDDVTAPALPAGWVATNPVGAAPLWVTSTLMPDTAPNDVFIDDPPTASDKHLDTADFAVFGPNAKVSFRHTYALDPVEGGSNFFDGAVLEVSSPNIAGGAFTDITSPLVGGIFVTGGYNGMISTAFSSPIGGRMAWSQNSGGYISTVANLGPKLAGHKIKFRFRMCSDSNVSGLGWRVDTIRVLRFCDDIPPTPTPIPCVTVLSENFDKLVPTPTPTPPAFPGWVISAIDPDTPPNDAFCSNPPFTSDNVLDFVVSLPLAPAILRFRNNFDTEANDGIFWDGGVLEVSSPNIAGGAFTDITHPAVGGSFLAGGYTGTITVDETNPLAGRAAWSGDSKGYIDTVVNLGPNLSGQTIRLRFRLGTDSAVEAPGWRIDTITPITTGSCPGK